MKVGDLVRHKNPKWNTLGIVINIGNFLVEVLWTNTEYIYLESQEHLEVVCNQEI